jgi:hypothetical protein
MLGGARVLRNPIAPRRRAQKHTPAPALGRLPPSRQDSHGSPGLEAGVSGLSGCSHQGVATASTCSELALGACSGLAPWTQQIRPDAAECEQLLADTAVRLGLS